MGTHEFSAVDTTLILGMVVLYIVVTSWLSVKLRSKTSEQFMNAAKSMPAVVVGVLLMTEFIGAKSTVGTAESAFKYGMAASWSVIAAAVGYLFYGLFFVKKLYGSGEFTISGAISQKYGRSTKLIVSAIMILALLLVNVGNYISGAAALTSVMHVNIPVAMRVGVTPVPIPNTMVKTDAADNTWLETAREDRWLPDLIKDLMDDLI